MRCRYLAGLWETDLILQLTWMTDFFGSTRQKEYCAPSWSWASVNCEVRLAQRYVNRVLTRVVEVQIELATEDEMGQVRGGFLRIRGHLIKIRHRGERNDKVVTVDGYDTSMEINMDESDWFDDDDDDDDEDSDNDDGDDDDEADDDDGKRFWCLPLTYYDGTLDCLVLSKIEHSHNTFRRVGIATQYDPTKDSTSNDFKNPFLRLAKDAAKMDNPCCRLVKVIRDFINVRRSSLTLTELKII